MIQTIDKPFAGVQQALVIAGSDRRGAAYGVFTLSEKMGVSPWYWWADVPVKKKETIFLEKGRFVSSGPAVKYRGIFINDESPAFRNWATEKFGGINHKVYEKICELLLRNKANFMWPSMWLPTMFHVDDTLNAKVADEFGIVVSTSHHEPMMRAHNEWSLFQGGAWDYRTNKEKLQEFWRGGVQRMGNYESAVTVGMRGDGDEGMGEGTAVDLLQTIIKDQRKILTEVTGKPAEQIPQVWAIYKEVQDYYDKGMRVDDDITILFSDDNWGNIRYLPKEGFNRKGGYGMYYHLDYVGAPVSYKWLNVSQIERIWEQMKITYEHGVKNLWIVNVGDIKPMEFPISFFMDYAWDPGAIQAEDLPKYYVNWVREQFGEKDAAEIAELLARYTKYNARRTPEMLTAGTYSVEHYREADRVVSEYDELAAKARKIYSQLGDNYKAAFFQLVLSPVEMCANLQAMYVAAAKNKYYGERGAAAANYYADKTKELFEKDARLAKAYHELEGGKWNHMMSQTHIGNTFWNHAPLNMMPPVSYVQVPKKEAELGFLLEYGSRPQWGWLDVEADWAFSSSLPQFDNGNKQDYYVDVINRGEEQLHYTLKAKEDWIRMSKDRGTVLYNEKVYVTIDWSKAPEGITNGTIVLSGAGKEYSISVPVRNNLPPASGFVENMGVVSIEAGHFTKKLDTKERHWTIVPNLGRTSSSITMEPVTVKTGTPGSNAPGVEYAFTVHQPGKFTIETFLSPTQDFRKQGGLKYAIAIDSEKPQVVNMNEGETRPDWEFPEWWTKSVGDHIKIKKTEHQVATAGMHTLKIWALDPGVVFQKFVIHTGGRPRASYLGAPESLYIKP
ncbi:glycosyl hydrolase 115 family protein [Paraflavisolibacter sp. H34]|uniref:glycosyl hydrolase 115 family protein n=1 Tax=Huijunlia imazamoxiresistens TaxID=3127457 RepID=UPI003015F9ED